MRSLARNIRCVEQAVKVVLGALRFHLGISQGGIVGDWPRTSWRCALAGWRCGDNQVFGCELLGGDDLEGVWLYFRHVRSTRSVVIAGHDEAPESGFEPV